MSTGLCLDAGALIAIERRERPVLALIRATRRAGGRIDVPAGVVAQAWRGSSGQAGLARFLKAEGIRFPQLDLLTARAVGEVCARTGTADVIDAHVALHARRHQQVVVTSDPEDIVAIAPDLTIVAV